MTALAPVAPRLGHLVRLLGSDKGGEVIATASAIGRTLHSVGADWHDLAEVVERAALPVVLEQPKPEAAPALKTWQITAMHCIRVGQGSLKTAELDFLRSMTHWPTPPTEKQARWLSAIASVLGVEVMA